MNFELSDTERLYRATLEDVVQRHLEPIISKHPRDRALPKEAMLELYSHLGDLGLTGARISEEDGGPGLSHLLLGLAMEALPAFLGISLVGHESSAKRISMANSEVMTEKFLPDLLSGRRLAGTASSEPDVGSDPRSIKTRAVRDGDSYLVSGTKLWTTNGAIADVVVAVVSLGESDKGENLITRIVIDRAESPFEASEVPSIGLQQGHLGELHFDNCRVPAENLLGEPGDAHKSLTATWLGNRPCLGLIGVGLAQRAVDSSIRYVKEREQFGRPIGSFQLVQEMLADMATSTDAARLMCYRAMALLDEGRWAATETSMAKYLGTETGVRVANQGIQLHGSNGLTKEFPLEQWLRDARMLTLPDGSTQIQQLIIGRELTGIRAFS